MHKSCNYIVFMLLNTDVIRPVFWARESVSENIWYCTSSLRVSNFSPSLKQVNAAVAPRFPNCFSILNLFGAQPQRAAWCRRGCSNIGRLVSCCERVDPTGKSRASNASKPKRFSCCSIPLFFSFEGLLAGLASSILGRIQRPTVSGGRLACNGTHRIAEVLRSAAATQQQPPCQYDHANISSSFSSYTPRLRTTLFSF